MEYLIPPGLLFLILFALGAFVVFCIVLLVKHFTALGQLHKLKAQSRADVPRLSADELYSEQSLEDLKQALWVHIKPQLYSPTTAKLSPHTEWEIHFEKGCYKISGHIDGINAYGGTIRQPFHATCSYSHSEALGGILWQVDSLYLL